MKKQRLQELAGILHTATINEGYAENLGEASTNDLDLMKSVIGKLNQSDEGNTIEAMEDGYYALADNLPNLINSIQKAIKIHATVNPKDMQEVKVLQNELKIYNDIRTLLDESTLGTLL
tara:strand:- start:76 stop:432 length:357 start_codon:yes stop_codon:yes gene_type:complete